jgi:uncharacterized membrane protein YczE
VDIFRIDVPAVAAVFAALFLGCTAWFWRRNSGLAAVALLLLFAFEVAVAPTLKHAATTTKIAVIALGLAGSAAAIAAFVTRRRARRSRALAA